MVRRLAYIGGRGALRCRRSAAVDSAFWSGSGWFLTVFKGRREGRLGDPNECAILDKFFGELMVPY